jgi:hypothetical protein
MKSFSEFLKEHDVFGTKTADMRMDRPATYNQDYMHELLRLLQNPKNANEIKKVLQNHPEMAKNLHDKVKDALIHTSRIDWYRAPDGFADKVNKEAGQKADSIISKYL